MKLLFALWILAVVTQEVYPSTLVRLRRHALSKPTSSVHTEYEATYEQKGKQGNGSYSTVSGKQQVVHNNCGDNWNAFADKCASLIKDLVASLANAVSSKPGDATNLQLRIKNTLTHFDTTDNCTCLNHTKNGLSGVDLSSLFDNLTITTVQPPTNNGKQLHNGDDDCESCHDDDDNHHDKSVPVIPIAPEQTIKQPKLVPTNNENVDPKLADTSDVSPSTNSRRGAQYPSITKIPPNTKPNVASPVAANPERVLPTKVATESPAEVIAPQSQPTNTDDSSPKQSPAIAAAPAELPTRNNNIERPASVLKPASVPSSASQISSPQPAVIASPNDHNNGGPTSGSGPIPGAKTPVVVPVTPVENTDHNEGSSPSKAIPVVQPVVPTETEPVNGAVAEPLTSKNGEGSPTITPVVLTQTTPSDSEDEPSDGEHDDGKKTSVAEPVVPAVAATTPNDHEDESPEGKHDDGRKTPVIVPVVPTNGKDHEGEEESPEGKHDDGKKTPAAVPVVPVVPVETKDNVAATTPNDHEDESPEGKHDDGKKTPVIVPVVPTNGKHHEGEEESPEGKHDDGMKAPAAVPVVPVVPVETKDDLAATAPSDHEDEFPEGKHDDGRKTPVIVPVVPTNGKDHEGIAETKTTAHDSDESDQDHEGTTPIPVIHSDKLSPEAVGTGIPKSEPLTSLKDSPTTASDTTLNNVTPVPVQVIPKQPNHEPITQNQSPGLLPVTNSNSNLPETSHPVNHETTDRPYPVYVPSKALPSPSPSNQHLEPSKDIENGVTPGLPTTTEHDDEKEKVSAGKPDAAVPAKTPENIFIVTPVPNYPEKTEEHETKLEDSDETTEKPKDHERQPSVAPVYVAPVSGTTPIPVQEIVPVTPVPDQVAAVPVVTHDRETPKAPAAELPEETDLTKPTTFQTTSTDTTPPQKSLQSPIANTSPSSSSPQDSDETLHHPPTTSPKTPKHDDDDDEEDCCSSCESCAEEEVTNPKQYKEIACKDLEEARRELKAIFDKIKKKLKCGRKAPEKVVAS